MRSVLTNEINLWPLTDNWPFITLVFVLTDVAKSSDCAASDELLTYFPSLTLI